jgi:hypothetical protein
MVILLNYLGWPDGQPEETVSLTTDSFGKADPKEMPLYFFRGALHIDYTTAVRAEVTAQDHAVIPRHWYIDATLRCADCGSEFVWLAEEQRVWFETYRFDVLSLATRCRDCRQVAIKTRGEIAMSARGIPGFAQKVDSQVGELPAWIRRGGRDQRNAAEPPR